MKIAIVSYPRTNSTHLQYALANKHNLTFMNEPLTLPQPDGLKVEAAKKIEAMDDCIVKLMSHNFCSLSYDIINWNQFDEIYFTSRGNVAEACMSNYLAASTNRWQNKPNLEPMTVDPFTVPISFINDFEKWIGIYNRMVADIPKMTSATIKHYTYEQINATPEFSSVTFNIIPNGWNYKELCLNYDEVVQRLNH